MPAAFKYQRLTQQDQLPRVQGRLSALEGEHFDRTLDIIVSTEESQVQQLSERKAQLEKQIADLRQIEAQLQPAEPAPEPPAEG